MRHSVLEVTNRQVFEREREREIDEHLTKASAAPISEINGAGLGWLQSPYS